MVNGSGVTPSTLKVTCPPGRPFSERFRAKCWRAPHNACRYKHNGGVLTMAYLVATRGNSGARLKAKPPPRTTARWFIVSVVPCCARGHLAPIHLTAGVLGECMWGSANYTPSFSPLITLSSSPVVFPINLRCRQPPGSGATSKPTAWKPSSSVRRTCACALKPQWSRLIHPNQKTFDVPMTTSQ